MGCVSTALTKERKSGMHPNVFEKGAFDKVEPLKMFWSM
jgi:hypothetical protein